MPLKAEISELLDKCVLLNTYFSGYFEPCGYVEAFDIYFRVDAFDDNFSMYEELDVINSDEISCDDYYNSLFVNGNVLENTEAGEKVSLQSNCEYAEYFTILREILPGSINTCLLSIGTTVRCYSSMKTWI